jgi:hypothetical protein
MWREADEFFAGRRTTTEKKASSGCSRWRCSCSSATTGKGEMDAARCRGYCGGVVLFRGRLDVVDWAADDSSLLRQCALVLANSTTPTMGCRQRQEAGVRLGVVVLVGMLECSGMVPGQRIDGATGCRSSVLVWAAVVL